MLKDIEFIAASPQAVELTSLFNVLFLSSASNIFKFEDCGAAFKTGFSKVSSSASLLFNKIQTTIFV